MELLFLLLLLFLVGIHAKRRYKKTGYQDASGHSYYETMTEPGRKGEFLTFRCLKGLGEQNKLLTNVYLPKQDGTTTEIDLIMIAPTGIYVFESKNYSGWIFGDEGSRYWTQSLNGGHKYKFYNPIWQNKKHISVLKNHLDVEDKVFKSYIIFSERCTLKKMSVHSPGVKVMNRDVLVRKIKEDIAESPDFLTSLEMDQIYNDLFRYALADATTKQAHIDAMNWRN